MYLNKEMIAGLYSDMASLIDTISKNTSDFIRQRNIRRESIDELVFEETKKEITDWSLHHAIPSVSVDVSTLCHRAGFSDLTDEEQYNAVIRLIKRLTAEGFTAHTRPSCVPSTVLFISWDAAPKTNVVTK